MSNMSLVRLKRLKDGDATEDLYSFIPQKTRLGAVVRLAKAVFGLTGHRSETLSYAGGFLIEPRNSPEQIQVDWIDTLPSKGKLVDFRPYFQSFNTRRSLNGR
jgi:hypothetical protein